MKKYKLIKNDYIISDNGKKLYRIKALKDFGNVKKGDIGGYIQGHHNLSHFGDCWVHDEACVCGSGLVFGSAWVDGSARVFGSAYVDGEACVSGKARVGGSARVIGSAYVRGSSLVDGSAYIDGLACVSGSAHISSPQDIVSISGLGSESRTTSIYRSQSGGILVSCGCFHGTLEEFQARIIKTHEDNKYSQEYLLLIKIVQIYFGV